MNEPAQTIPASDFSTRLTVGIVLVALACTAIWLGGWPFRLFVLAAASIMLLEWAAMHGLAKSSAYAGMAALAVLLLGAAQWLFPVAYSNPDPLELAMLGVAWQGFALAVALALALGLLARRAAMAGGFLYVAIPSLALIALDWAWMELVLWAMIVTWATDICAYFAGRSIGGPKLAPRLSPNKTWAGLIGGVAGAALFGFLIARAFDLGSPFLWLGAPMAVLAQAGDLYESAMKRRAGVKDSGAILPGHGGALDRLDGLLPVVLATFLILATGLGIR